MKAKLDIERIENYNVWLQEVAEQYTGDFSIQWYSDHIGEMCGILAFVNEQMAVAKEQLNTKKKRAYETLALSSVANSSYFSPTLAKDYIAAKCYEEQYAYDLSERVSRTITHTIEALRSILSAMKEEAKMTNYSSQAASSGTRNTTEKNY